MSRESLTRTRTTPAKTILLKGVRAANRILFSRGLPNRVAFYFHSLDVELIESFQLFVTTLRSQGYRFCGLKEYVEQDSGDRRAFISFDDNYVSWYEQLPLFAAHGVTCTFYLNTLPLRDRSTHAQQQAFFDRIGYRGKRTPLSSTEVSELAAAGHTIACHTHSHRKLSELPLAEGQREMLVSKDLLEEIVQKPVEDFSYPFGMPRYFPAALKEYARTIGFTTIASAMPCMLHAKIDRMSIQRHGWRLQDSVEDNVRDAGLDGRLIVNLFRRSPIG